MLWPGQFADREKVRLVGLIARADFEHGGFCIEIGVQLAEQLMPPLIVANGIVNLADKTVQRSKRIFSHVPW